MDSRRAIMTRSNVIMYRLISLISFMAFYIVICLCFFLFFFSFIGLLFHSAFSYLCVHFDRMLTFHRGALTLLMVRCMHFLLLTHFDFSFTFLTLTTSNGVQCWSYLIAVIESVSSGQECKVLFWDYKYISIFILGEPGWESTAIAIRVRNYTSWINNFIFGIAFFKPRWNLDQCAISNHVNLRTHTHIIIHTRNGSVD